MASLQARLSVWIVKWRVKRRLKGVRDYRVARKILRPDPYKVPPTVQISPAHLGGVPGERLEGPSPGDIVLLYLHGGGYFGCSAETHRPVTTFFALQGFRVFAPDYRLAPENRFPAAVEDAVAFYRGLLSAGYSPQNIVVAGESAGGGLSLSLMLALRAAGVPLPAAAALFSPWTDLAATGDSIRTNTDRCAMFEGAGVAYSARYYLGDTDPRNPLASPLYADLTGLPPLLIHVGADEVLRDDSTRLAERARAAGVAVELKIWPVVPHAWQLVPHLVPEARQSLRESAAFLRTYVPSADSNQEVMTRMADLAASSANSAVTNVDVLIVGAGFSGICMGIKLLEAGMKSFLIMEKSCEIGGTWWDNRYPGCACDIPSHLYSFSFAPSTEWTRMYPGQQEIQDYLKRCVEHYALAPYLRLNTRFREAVWDESEGVWNATAGDGMRIRARVLVSGMGALHVPRYPGLKGLDRFKGPAFHSSAWDHSVDLVGKSVAVVGTGASSIQFVPQIAPRVGKLHLFQRTPPWIVPRLDFAFSEKWRRRFRSIPVTRWALRQYIFWRQEFRVLGFLGNETFRKKVEAIALRHLARAIKDPKLRAAFTPNYQLGCKRVLVSDDYYPTFNRSNVELVTESIAEVRDHSFVTGDGVERPIDVLIYGTGFRATEPLIGCRVVGKGGVEIHHAWGKRMSAYLGVTVSGFPNFFMLLGPNTGLGHNSVVLMIEAQVRYAMKCLTLMRRRKQRVLEVRPEIQQSFVEEIYRRMAGTVWQSGGCKSWYQDQTTGEITTLWPGSVVSYLRRTRSVSPSDYQLSS